MSQESLVKEKSSEEYWIRRLKNFSNAASNGFNNFLENPQYEDLQIAIPENLSERLDAKFAGENLHASKYLFYASVLRVVCWRYGNNPDIVIASGYQGRPIFLRMELDRECRFREMVYKEQQLFIGSIKHSRYHYHKMMRKLELNDMGEENRLLQLGLVFEDFQPYHSVLDKCNLLVVIKNGLLRLRYSTKVFDKETSAYFADNYVATMERLFCHPELKISDVDILSGKEKEALNRFVQPEGEFDIRETVLDHFASQVKTMPDGIAIVCGERKMSYRELNERSDATAWFLKNRYGIQAKNVVAIILDRSERLAVTTLGILKTGSAYVAIDKTYPEERKQYVLRDSGCSVLITETDDVDVVKRYWEGEVIGVDQIPAEITAAFPLLRLHPDSGAFMIYTSGSTGVPKGMMQTHKCLFNVVMRQVLYGGFGPGLRVLQYSSVSFDVYIAHELFFSLLSGGSLYFIREDERRDLVSLGKFIADQGIEWLLLPVSALNTIVEVSEDLWKEGLRLKHLVSAGEQLNLSKKLISYFKMHSHIRLHNFYGPSETHNAANYTINDDEKLDVEQPVGRPSTNTWIYILSEDWHWAPVGVPGELYISGAGLAQGYVNRDELTKEKFIPNPFLPGELMYKTGDIGRWLPDGNIMFMGRIDDQVKIRGNRVELGEIENRLLKHREVHQCAVVALEEKGAKELVGYIVGKEGVSVASLRSFLLESLPEYMVPGRYIQLKELPLNSNGKVDKKKLPAPEGLSIGSGAIYTAPRNDIEQRLVKLWQAVLEREGIGVKDDFFGLGGHSLKATRLGSFVHQEFNVKIPLRELFSFTVLEEQAALISKARKELFINIPVATEQQSYMMSSAQRRLWILSMMEQSSIAYNMRAVYELEGGLDRDALLYSFQTLIQRHEILRTVFKAGESGEPRQYILPADSNKFDIVYNDLRGEALPEEAIRAGIADETVKPFDLATGPLLRAVLYQTEDAKWIFVYTMHHIISDGWSIGIVIKEILQFYNAYKKGEKNPFKLLRIQYKDYACWQQEQMRTDAQRMHREYWLKQLGGELPVLELPGDRLRPAIKNYRGGMIKGKIGKGVSEELRAVSQGHGCTLFMGLLAAVNALLHRYTGQEDIITGSPIAGREHADLEGQIGFYLNMLPLRIQVKSADTFEELLSRVKDITLGAYEHQAYPFDELVDEVDIRRDVSRSALFDVMVVLQNSGTENVEEALSTDGLKVRRFGDEDHRFSKFDLTFSFMETGPEIQYELTYNDLIYDKATAIRLRDHLDQLLAKLAANPDRPLGSLDYLTCVEKLILLKDFNAPRPDYSSDRTIVELFEEQVQKTPNVQAVVYGDRCLTYRELDERANQLGHFLRKKGVRAGTLVPMCMERSAEMILCILGILKAGGAYVPIDPEFPFERIRYIIKDTDAFIVLISSLNAHKLTLIDDPDVAFVEIDDHTDVINSETRLPLSIRQTFHDLAYMIYTSGSTGKPKGVMIEHKSIVDYTYGLRATIDIEGCHSFALLFSPATDIGKTVIYSALLSGGTLHVIPSADVNNARALLDYFKRHSIDFLKIVPSLWKALSLEEVLLPYRILMFGGEVLTGDILKSIESTGVSCQVVNHYGPTETTIGKLLHVVSPRSKQNWNIPIGRPFCNTSIYILDKGMQLCPVGVIGDIWIGGDGLARGYWNDPVLTSERFIPDPFKENERIYRTGDLGRWQLDGNIEFIGRKDDQVKIRGYRIEAAEIEHALVMHENIHSAVVITKNNRDGEKELVAYLLADIVLVPHEIKQYLSRKLPAYMLPGCYVQLKKFPLMPNGKVDKRSLPLPEDSSMDGGITYVAPRNETEERLVMIWREILSKDQIGIKDDFFHIGGHSLKAIQLISRISQSFDVSLTLLSIFNNPTIEGVATEIGNIQWMDKQAIDSDNSIRISI